MLQVWPWKVKKKKRKSLYKDICVYTQTHTQPVTILLNLKHKRVYSFNYPWCKANEFSLGLILLTGGLWHKLYLSDTTSRTGIFKADQNLETQMNESESRILPFFPIPTFIRHPAWNQILLASPPPVLATATNTILCGRCKLHAGTACLTGPHSYHMLLWVPLPPCPLMSRWTLALYSLEIQGNYVPGVSLWRVAGDKNWGTSSPFPPSQTAQGQFMWLLGG